MGGLIDKKTIFIALFAFAIPVSIVGVMNAEALSTVFEVDPSHGKIVYYRRAGG